MPSATTQLLHIPDWEQRAEARLLVPWRKPRIRAFVRALAQGAQYHEDESLSLVMSCGLDEATGHALDQWGELVGEQRLSLSDSEYRQFIQARMLVNRCSGLTDELIEILETAAGPHLGVYSETLQPACLTLVVVRNAFLVDAAKRRVARLMTEAAPAGRNLVVVEALNGGFGFDDALADIPISAFSAGGFARRIL